MLISTSSKLSRDFIGFLTCTNKMRQVNYQSFAARVRKQSQPEYQDRILHKNLSRRFPTTAVESASVPSISNKKPLALNIIAIP